jgi:ABC-2 type transport system ATP-binding protein
MGMVCGMSRSAADQRSYELLKWLGIDAFAEKNIKGFSAGMKQKLSLAQSLIHEPEILILDEPTANLDPAGRLSIIENLKELCKEANVTVFISSHILAELEKLVNDVTLINHGQLVVESDVKSLEKKVSGDRFILKTSNNEKLLNVLEKRSYVKHVEMDDNDILHITSQGDQDQFRKRITHDILVSDVWLEQFNIESSDLESVFMKLVGEGEEKQIVDDRQKPKRHRWRFGK